MHPNIPIINKANSIESLAKIIDWLYFDNISLINPNPGNINMYTSGCPKNQNRCWNNNTSPPLIISKKHPLKCLSNITIVIHAANTGNDIINNNDVINIDHGNNGKYKYADNNDRFADFNNDTIKFIDPNNDDNPIICKLKNIISIL